MQPPGLLAMSLLCVLALLPTAGAGTSGEPEVVDPAGDADAAGTLDITAAWVDASDPSAVAIHILVPKLPAPPAETGACGPPGCVAAAPSFEMEFTVLAPGGTPAPLLPGYNRTYAVYRHGAPAGVQAAVGHLDAAGALVLTGNATATVADGEVVVRVQRSDSSVAVPAGLAPGAYSIAGLVVRSSLQACHPMPPAGVEAAPAGTACDLLPQPTVATGTPPVGTASHADTAPDSGGGATFTFPSPPPKDTEEPARNATGTPTLAPPPATGTTSTTSSSPPAASSGPPTTSTTASTTSAPAKGTSALGLAGLLAAAGVALAVRRRIQG